MISCRDAVKQLWDYLEHELTPEERSGMEQHLAFCRRCCGELEFAEELRAFLGQAARPELPGDVEARLTAFLDTIDQAAAEEETQA